MDRKEFLKGCAGSLCVCAAACMPAPASGAEPEQDWRIRFVQQRYAKLLEILSSEMDDAQINETLFQLGRHCSSLAAETLEKYRGDVEGYAEHIRKSASADIITYDRDKGVITMTTDERPDCFCPFNGVAFKTPAVVCRCSLGWQTNTWKTILQKDVEVELKEAVLHGGKRCTFEIRIAGKPTQET